MLPGWSWAGCSPCLAWCRRVALTWHQPPEMVAEANQIYVFQRLPHHLSLLTLPTAEISWSTRTARSADPVPVDHCHTFVNRRVAIAIRFGCANRHLVCLGRRGARGDRLCHRDRVLEQAGDCRALCFVITGSGVRRRRAAGRGVSGRLAHRGGASSGRNRGPCGAWLRRLPSRLAHRRSSRGATGSIRCRRPTCRCTTSDAWADACDGLPRTRRPTRSLLTSRMALTFKWRAGRPEVVT